MRPKLPFVYMNKDYGYGRLRCHEDNLPLPRPGCYRVYCVNTGLTYIGGTRNILQRARDYSSNSQNVQQIAEFVRRHGKGSLVFEPLYYTIATTGTRKALGLHFVEQSLIKEYNSIDFGWNNLAPDVAALSKRPVSIEKRLATEATPETKARRREAKHRYWQGRAITYTHNGRTERLREWARVLGIPYVTLYWRYVNGKQVI